MVEHLHTIPLDPAIVSVWRLLFWLGAVLVVGQLLGDAVGHGGLRSTRLMRWVVIIMIARFCLVQAERWNEPALWEGLPAETVALLLAVAATWYYRQPDEDEARDATGVPRRGRR